jgi:hypothetical protein
LTLPLEEGEHCGCFAFGERLNLDLEAFSNPHDSTIL